MTEAATTSSPFAVRGVFWRRTIDWIVRYVPAFLHPPLVFLATLLFFFLAAPARHTIVDHLAVIFPGSSRLTNYLRAFRVFRNFGWALTDAAAYRLLKAPFHYEVIGDKFLQELTAAHGAIVLTAHLGNYDLGAAVFTERLHRDLRIVRAPEPDAATAAHLDRALEESGGGAVKVDYNTDGTSLSFDLLSAIRRGEIVSMQGDRVIGEVSLSPVLLFGREVLLPNGPFVLALVAGVPIYPLFVIRSGHRSYRFLAREPILCARGAQSRDEAIAAAMAKWSQVLENEIRENWPQWYAFTPVF